MSTSERPPTAYVHVSRTTDTPTPAAQAQTLGRLRRELLAVVDEFQREYAAEHSSPTVATLHTLAQSYDRATTEAHRADLATEVAEELSLAEAGTIRRAAEAVKLATLGLIIRAAVNGTDAATIARELSVSPSYVRRLIRNNRAMIDFTARELAEQSAPTTD